MLMLTGLRRREASNASWPEFGDMEAKRWDIPSTRMKGAPGKARDHLVLLAPDIVTLLESLPRHIGGDFLFSYLNGTKPIVAFSTAMNPVDLRHRVEEEILNYIDDEAWERAELVEQAERASIRQFSDTLKTLR
jgi:integrase